MGLKDRVISTGAEKVIGYFLDGIGKIQELSIDSKERTIRLSMLLKGETEPVDALINGYEIISRDDKTFMKINTLSSSRSWAEAAFNRYMKGQLIEIPGKYASMVSALL